MGRDKPVNRLGYLEQKPLYDASDCREIKTQTAGDYPFTRGIYPNMYRGKLWTMRQYAGFGSAKESNERFRYLLEQGQTGLSVAFDLPTQIGLDPDHPLASSEIGKVGVSIATIRDMEDLLQDIPLDAVSISMTINSTAAILLAMVLSIAKRRNIPWGKLRGTIQNDILKEYIARGTYIYPPGPSMRISVDIIAFCQKHVPRWNPISISGYHIREAGSSAVQEVAFTFANGIAYIENAVQSGLEVDEFAGQLSFFFNAHNNFLEEIAKFRAARRLWAKIMRERFSAKNPRSWSLRFHTQTAGCTLTAKQPENNIVRVALQALSAILGGTQSLHTNSMDEALALPSEEAATIALRTQQILAYESGVANTVDPVGGSYAIESMADKIEEKATDYLKKIETLGGTLKAIESGYIQREIQESAYEYQKQVETGENVLVGVNKFCGEGNEAPLKLLQVNERVAKDQIENLESVRKQRNPDATREALQDLAQAAQDGRNLMPPIMQAVDSLATIGEISNCLREVFGEFSEVVGL